MKHIAIGALLALVCSGNALAGAPQPLTVGAVRDQAGDPVSGAEIRLFDASGKVLGSATSAPDGTFAAEVSAASRVRVTCDFCLPLDLVLAGDEPVVAIVHRFDALLHDVPSQADADALPYAHIESTISLAPFVVLADSSG
ncbi:MAG: carboxypeptidase-like regulatory domain-containing protein, partial [Candidatus Eremiobacteraeota bacterium]|nr:carboxypeptidase-like regulatory domain-containing protein [Candidatus Eremiobacteraeota bacterium]